MNLNRGDTNLNPALVKQQKLKQVDVDKILDIHDEKNEIIEKLIFSPILPNWKTKELVLELEDLEFMCQKAWKLPQDKKMHTWYRDLDHCTCDKSLEWFGKERPIDVDCPLHNL